MRSPGILRSTSSRRFICLPLKVGFAFGYLVFYFHNKPIPTLTASFLDVSALLSFHFHWVVSFSSPCSPGFDPREGPCANGKRPRTHRRFGCLGCHPHPEVLNDHRSHPPCKVWRHPSFITRLPSRGSPHRRTGLPQPRLPWRTPAVPSRPNRRRREISPCPAQWTTRPLSSTTCWRANRLTPRLASSSAKPTKPAEPRQSAS